MTSTSGVASSDEDPSKVCVIGAGPSGLAIAKVLSQRGIAFDCYESSASLGGLWAINDREPGCGYASLHSNTSKRVMEFPSFPMPMEFPDYPHHSQVTSYLESFVDQFGFSDSLLLNNPVDRVVADEVNGGWLVAACGDVKHYRAVVVASGGRHGKPNSFRIPGTFGGSELHSYDYYNSEKFIDRRVLIVGLGATSADIAVEVARVAARTDIGVRTGHYILPNIFSGKPIDETSPLIQRLSVERRRPLIKLLLQLTHGPMSNYGLPDPPYSPGEAPFIASSGLLVALKQGQIAARPEPVSAVGETVTFADGTTGEYDSIVYCTGYDISFPFLDDVVAIAPDDSPSLYRHVAHPDLPDLFFLGLVHSTTALMPVAEAQAEWIGDLVSGHGQLPGRDDMWKTIRADRRRQEARFYDTSMHLLEDLHEYVDQVEAERSLTRSGQQGSLLKRVFAPSQGETLS